MAWYKKFNVVYDTLNEKWERGFIKNRIINAYLDNGEFIDDKELRENDGQIQIYEIKSNSRPCANQSKEKNGREAFSIRCSGCFL